MFRLSAALLRTVVRVVGAKLSKTTQKPRKCTLYMCGAMLRYIRLQMGFAPRDMRAVLVDPKAAPLARRTYENYEAGTRTIPAELAARIRELFRSDQEFMNNICAGVNISIGPRVSPDEVLRQQQLAEFEAGIIRVPVDRKRGLNEFSL